MENRQSGTCHLVTCLKVMDPHGFIDGCMEWSRCNFRSLVWCLAYAGFGKVRVIDGRRTYDQQCRIYGRGRTRIALESLEIPGDYGHPDEDVVSWLLPSRSRHVKGLAIDVDFQEYDGESLGAVEDICRQLGITWGGVWSVRDYGHFEV